MQEYDRLEWFQDLVGCKDNNERAMLAVLSLFGVPHYHIDLGCGDGTMLSVSRRNGAKVLGVEVSGFVHNVIGAGVQVVIKDLGQPLDLDGEYDLVTCIEVAEHLEPSSSEMLMDNIADVTSERLVFTAAPPGQGGIGHINCQPKEYWSNGLGARGLHLNDQETKDLRKIWKHTTGNAIWLPANVMVFSK